MITLLLAAALAADPPPLKALLVTGGSSHDYDAQKALITEGLKILVVWLGVALREGAQPATLGVVVGATLIGALAVSLGRTGIFRCVPRFLWDGSAACLVMAYGSNFLALALAVS